MNENITGKRINELLREKGMTQRQLAEKVMTTEVSMSRFVSGARVPNGPILANIANVLGVTTDYLLGKTDKKDGWPGKWILCSERMPEDGTYLATMDGELCGQAEAFTGMCGFENGKWDEDGMVIAWMPLPEPYKENENAEES